MVPIRHNFARKSLHCTHNLWRQGNNIHERDDVKKTVPRELIVILDGLGQYHGSLPTLWFHTFLDTCEYRKLQNFRAANHSFFLQK